MVFHGFLAVEDLRQTWVEKLPPAGPTNGLRVHQVGRSVEGEALRSSFGCLLIEIQLQKPSERSEKVEKT